MFHADGRTDVTKLTVDFRNFANKLNRRAGDNAALQAKNVCAVTRRKSSDTCWRKAADTDRGCFLLYVALRSANKEKRFLYGQVMKVTYMLSAAECRLMIR